LLVDILLISFILLELLLLLKGKDCIKLLFGKLRDVIGLKPLKEFQLWGIFAQFPNDKLLALEKELYE
jgi:hypothetical protein